MKIYLLLLVCVFDTNAATINIPSGHPRLWFTSAESLNQARHWYETNQITPGADDYLAQAFVSVMTETPGSCQQAVDYANNVVIDVGGTASNSARWYGETVLLIYDWCYSQFTPEERAQFTLNWNTWQQTLNTKLWGNEGMEANNFYWGYLRNGIEWGIVSHGENPLAQGFLDVALDERFQDGMVEKWAPSFGKGGVTGEGLQYGRYLLDYGIVPLLSAQNYGFDTYAATNFYKENLFYLIYSSLPKKTPAPPASSSNCPNTYWYMFPFNDDEFFPNCYPSETVKTSPYGNAVSSYIKAWPQSNIAGYAQQWINTIQPFVSPWIASITPTVPAISFSHLPLDYLASGSGYAYLRNKWQEDATVINLQLGVSGNLGHIHLDAGSFQIWQNGQWLSRETTSYSDPIINWGGGSDTVEGNNGVGHNVVLFEGYGQLNTIPPSERVDGLPKITRIHQHPDFFYASTDLSKIYRASENEDPCRFDWPYAESVVRDFLYLRDLNILVILDRLSGSSDSISYADGSACTWHEFNEFNPVKMGSEVTKTFLLHFLNQPQVVNNQVISITNNEKLIMTTLLPENPTYRIINEEPQGGNSVGQYRLELDDSGQSESYFLNVLQFGGNSLQASNIQFTQNQSSFTINIGANHSINLKKGMASSGGNVTINNVTTSLLQCQQNISVTDNGPVWGLLDCIIFKSGFE